MQSPFSAYSAGEAVLFTCTAPYWRYPIDVHLYKSRVDTPLVTQRADVRQTRVELTLSDLETSHQGSYSCLYRIQGNPGNSPSSNIINITVGKCTIAHELELSAHLQLCIVSVVELLTIIRLMDVLAQFSVLVHVGLV